MAKADFLKEKAETFLEDAQYDISREKWFAAAFHLEQTVQLYLKYFLFKKYGDYPKIHSLNELFDEFKKGFPEKSKEIEKIQKDKASVIGDLNQAYITSRYLPVDFTRQQIEKMLEFATDLIKFLKKL